jgi:hypothetical protein
MIRKDLPTVPGIVILILLVGFMIAGSVGIYSEYLKKMLADSSSLKSRTLPQSEPTAKLLPEIHHESAASVTEHTTKSLETYHTGDSENKARSSW